jgi:hypothetical protein
MGEAPDRLTEKPGVLARRLEGEITGLRGELGDLITELDRRRRELFDLRLQIHRHPLAFGLAAAGLLLTAGGLVALAVHRRQRRRAPLARARRLRTAVARMVERPDRVAMDEPSLGGKLLGAAGGALVATLTRQMTQRALQAARRPQAMA